MLYATNIRLLDNCINRAMHKIFGISNSQDLWQLRNFFGFSSIRILIESRRQKFIDGLLSDNCYKLLFDVLISDMLAYR